MDKKTEMDEAKEFVEKMLDTSIYSDDEPGKKRGKWQTVFSDE